MSLSSFCVVTNALRLNLVNIRDNGKKHKRQPVDLPEIIQLFTAKAGKKEEIQMKTMKIEGMMCCHCEAPRPVEKTL